MPTPYQPIFASPDAPSDAELNFIEESPPGFFPENPESNTGLFRRIFSNLTQEAADELLTIYTEKFVTNSQIYLDEWENQMGLPMTPNIDLAHRRARVLARVQQGALSRAKRNSIIEQYIQATFGNVITFGPVGVILGAGVPLFAAAGNVSQLYRVYEDVTTFSYQVWIDSTIGPDITGLTRELTHVTPSGISFTIDYLTKTGTQLINWANTVSNYAPNGWWRLSADYNDYSGFAQNGTVTGAPTALAAPGLLPGVSGTDGGRVFSGTGQYVSISDSAQLDSPLRSIHALARPDALPGSGLYQRIFSSSQNNFIGIRNIGGVIRFVFKVDNGTTSLEVIGTTLPVVGTTYSVVGTYDGVTAKLYVNGALEASQSFTGPLALSSAKRIAASPTNAELWNGALDEIIIFGYPLAAKDVLYLYRQAQNLL